jgi:prepilin-type N-terminal cleavage/methylation domain-containing protein
MKFSKRSGFTLLEALVVILIVGILAAVAIYSLNLTRASNRDAKRVSDVSVIRAALTQYWLQKASYPQNTAVDLGRPGAGADALTIGGFVSSDQISAPVFLQAVPTGPNAGEYYRYHGSAGGYSLKFTTERPTAYGAAGTWYAHSSGVDKQDVEK